MILTSLSEHAGRTPPDRGTFDPQIGTGPPSGWDWDRVEALYAFVRARAFERLHEDEWSGDVEAHGEHRQGILVIDDMCIQAQDGDPVVASCAITFFRALAMRDANHPDFLGEWLGAPAPRPRSA